MKKLLFVGFAALSLITACNKTVVVDEPNPQVAIGFDSFVGKSTKADVTTSNLTQFYVYGYTWNPTNSEPGAAVFNKKEVTHNGSDWEYSPLRYWIEDNNYCFTAIGPNTTGWTYEPADHSNVGNADPNANGCGTITFNNSAAAANVDLVAAYETVKKAAANEGPVSFTFNHLLSRVKFEFENHFASTGVALTISDVSLEGVDTKASYDMSVAQPSWTTTTDNSSMSISFDKASEMDQDYCTNGTPKVTWRTEHKYIIPLEKSYVVSFTVTMYSVDRTGTTTQYITTGTSNKRVTLPSTEFKPGYSYNFVAALDQNNAMDTELSPIVFTVSSVEGWNDFTNTNVPMLGLSEKEITLNSSHTSANVVAAATYGTSTTYTVEYSCSTSDDTRATATMNDNVCTITKAAAATAGTATVTITATIKEGAEAVGTVSKNVTVTVE